MQRGAMKSLVVLTLAGVALASCGGAGQGAPPDRAASGQKGRHAGEGMSCKRTTSDLAPTRLSKQGAGSTVALATHQGRTLAYVADEDDKAVHVLDVKDGTTVATTVLEGRPSQLLLLGDGRLVVALRDRSALAVLETAGSAPELLCSVSTPSEPVGLALTPDDRHLLVTAAWGKSLSVLDTAELKKERVLPLAREPRGVVVSADGKRAFVAHAVGGKASVVDLEANKVTRRSLEARHDHEIEELHKKLRATGERGSGDDRGREQLSVLEATEEAVEKAEPIGRRTSCQGFALVRSLEGDRIYAPQVLVDPGNGEQRTVGYGEENVQTELPSVAVIDAASGHPMASSLAVNNQFVFAGPGGEETEHCILPRAADVDQQSGSLYVSCFGIDMVVAYDARAVDPARAEQRRWRVGAGPSGVAVDPAGRRLVVWSQFDRALNVISIDGPLVEKKQGADQEMVARFDVPVSTERQLTVAQALGRSLFHASGDSRIAKDGRACASCHPDGRDDGLVWATPNGPRRTKMLAGTLVHTAPYSWDGDNPGLREHVADTFDRLAGVGGLRSVELRALTAYVQGLEPPPKRAVDNADPLVKRGAEIFASEKAGCAKCHAGAELTDNKLHDVKSKTRADRAAQFNTPTLKFVSGRAPYYHDGRFATLRDVLSQADGDMGHTKHLSDADLDALERFLQQL